VWVPPQTVDGQKYASVLLPCVKAYQRKQLLERVGRDGSTVGAQIPDSIEIQGEQLDLRTFVFEIKRRETIPAGERERVDKAKRTSGANVSSASTGSRTAR